MKKGWLRRALRWIDAGRQEEFLPAARPAPETDDLQNRIHNLNSAQLCRGWRVSFLAVVSAKSEAELELLARKRRLYLDELERRNPAGFRAWLESSPGASSDPEPYLLDEAGFNRPSNR